MTAVVDRIDSAADRIKDDEFLADKKRVSPFFFFSASTLFFVRFIR
jgi:hypothetical protein